MRLINRRRSDTDLKTLAGRAYEKLPADRVDEAAEALATANPLPAADLKATAIGTPLFIPPLANVLANRGTRPSEIAVDIKAGLRRALKDAKADRLADMKALAAVGQKTAPLIKTGDLQKPYQDLAGLPALVEAAIDPHIAALDAQITALAALIDDVETIVEPPKPLRIRQFTLTSDTPSETPELRLVVPPGFKILGGGAVVNFDEPGNLLTTTRPENQTTWLARGKSHVNPSPATITIHVVALFDPDNDFEVRITESVSQPGFQPSTSIKVDDGFVLTGGGAQADLVKAGHLLTASFPSDLTTWTASSQRHVTDENSVVHAYAIGLRSRKGRALATFHSNNTSESAAHPVISSPTIPRFPVVGGGARSNSAAPGSLLTATIPDGTNGWRAASKDHHLPSPATVTAFAIGLGDTVEFKEPVADPTPAPEPQPTPPPVVIPAPAPAPSPQLPKLRVKVFTQKTNLTSTGPQLSFTVPKGFKILSGGARIDPPNAAVMLTTCAPQTDGKEVVNFQAFGKNQIPNAAAHIEAFVIALEDPNNEFEVKLFVARVNNVQNPSKVVRVDPGFTLTGGGVSITTFGGNTFIHNSSPNGTDGWNGEGRALTSITGILDVTAIGIRARNGRPLPSVITGSKSDTVLNPKRTVDVFPNHTLVGGGAHIDFPAGLGSRIVSSIPDGNTWSAEGFLDGASPSNITAFAIGLADVELIPGIQRI